MSRTTLLIGAGVILVLAGIGLALVLRPALAVPVATSPGGTVRITMGEFYFRPDTVTLKAGQEVTIELVNQGSVEHEFMVGRDVHREDSRPEGYMHDFFQGLNVRYTLDKAEFEQKPEHGTGVEVEPGGRATLTFTVPSDRVGEWEMGCFVPGHYEAGMKGRLVVTR
jgi:uncharacterized cupredoxin-like copper-binding protein